MSLFCYVHHSIRGLFKRFIGHSPFAFPPLIEARFWQREAIVVPLFYFFNFVWLYSVCGAQTSQVQLKETVVLCQPWDLVTAIPLDELFALEFLSCPSPQSQLKHCASTTRQSSSQIIE